MPDAGPGKWKSTRDERQSAFLAGSLAIAWITVGYKALLAALVNPASSLKG
jgi:hypothetical protein